MFDLDWPNMVPIVAIIGGISVAIVNSIGRARIRELEIRERIAMIEKGMVPSPEADPNGFERRMHAMDRLQHGRAAPRFRAGGGIRESGSSSETDNRVRVRSCVHTLTTMRKTQVERRASPRKYGRPR